MGYNGLSRYPLLTFTMACVGICFIIIMHRKHFKIKSVLAVLYLGVIESLGITIIRLNHKYFTLTNKLEILLYIVIFTSGALMLILVFYIGYKCNKRTFGKLPKLK